MKKKFVFLLFLACLLLGASSKEDWDNIPILETEIIPKSEVHGVSVGQNDEVSIDFDDGTVFLYDKNGQFLIGYKFPDIQPYSYDVTLNKDSDLINRYISSGTRVYVYNRAGLLVLREEVPYENRRNYYMTNPLNRTDSNGTVYELKKTNIEKIYSDGRREVFFVGYKSYRDEILAALAAIALFGGAYIWKKNLLPEEIAAEIKARFSVK